MKYMWHAERAWVVLGENVCICVVCVYMCVCVVWYMWGMCVCGLYVCEMCGMLLWYVYGVHVGYVHGYGMYV